MGGDEVDAGPGTASAVIMHVGRSGKPRGKDRQDTLVSLPEPPHGVPILVVPLGPARREVADLVSVRAGIPGLGDQLDRRQRRILRHRVEEPGMFVVFAVDARESRGEVEAETIDAHFLMPVAQAVHYHAQHIRVAELERVSRAGEIAVVTLGPGHQGVVGVVVDPPKAERRSQLVAFRSVVVNHVEDDLDAGVVHLLYERFEPSEPLCSQIVGMRREESDRIISPIVAQSTIDQMAVMDERMDRQKFDRGNAEVAQISNDRWRRQAGKRAAYAVPDLWVTHRVPLDVQFVDYGFVPRMLIRPPSPGERGIDHLAFRQKRRAVAVVEGQILRIVANPVSEQGVVPRERTDERLGVGVDQQFMMVEAMARLRLIRSVHPIAIELPRPHVRQVTVPYLVRVFRQSDPCDFPLAVAVEQTKLDLFGMGREQREVRARTIPCRAHRTRPTGPYANVRCAHLRFPGWGLN